jgi:nicotinate-nucleotide adenylyltransferase
MNIALLGGAFNPPHLGHLEIAKQLLERKRVDEVWFVPTYQDHHLRSAVVSSSDRVAMLESMLLPHMRVSLIEIDHTLDGKTIHLLPYLPKEHTYTFVIGADWLASFQKWEQWEELLKAMAFLVIPRKGFLNEPLYTNMIVFHPIRDIPSISATEIRRRVQEKLPIDAFVPQKVAEYIKILRLYI